MSGGARKRTFLRRKFLAQAVSDRIWRSHRDRQKATPAALHREYGLTAEKKEVRMRARLRSLSSVGRALA